MPFLNYKVLKLQLRVFLAGHTVALVTYYVMERTTSCSPIVGQFFDTMIAHQAIKSGYNDPRKSKCRKLFGTTLNRTKSMDVNSNTETRMV